MRPNNSGSLMLLVTALVWGLSFISQTVGMEHVGPFTFQSTRYFLGGLVMLPVIAFRDRKGFSTNKPASRKERNALLRSGLLCGTLLFLACSLQQHALLYTTAGKTAFLSTMYIILVPFTGILFHRSVRAVIWVSALLGLAGLYLLCGSSHFSLGTGELLSLGCAFGFTFHILAVGQISPKVDGVRLSAIQFLVCSLLSALCMLFTEKPRMEDILHCWMPICYSGILSAGVGYTLQIIGQARTEPAIASLLMSLESVFATLFGWLLLQQTMSVPELLGCLLMFAGVVLTQLPDRKQTV